MTKALGKEGSFAEGPSNSPRQRFFLKSWKFLCRGPGSRPSAKVFKKNSKKNYFFAEGRPSVNNFFKKKHLPRAFAIALGKGFLGKILKISLPGAREEALGKQNSKKPFLYRGSALGKETANGAGAWWLLFFAEGRPGSRQRLCRVSDKGPSAKTPSPSKNSLRGLCRGQPSAKPLPRVSSPWLLQNRLRRF